MQTVLLIALALPCVGTFEGTSFEDETCLLQEAVKVEHASMESSSERGALWLKFGVFQSSAWMLGFQDTADWCTTGPASIVFNGTIAGYFVMNGVVILWALLKERRHSQALLGSDTKVTDARILETHKETKGEDTTWHCSYEFIAERNDGTQCRVEVKSRSVPFASYKILSKDAMMPVHYSPEDPSECRLTCVAEVESFICRAGNCIPLFTAICMLAGGLGCLIGVYCAWLPFGIPSLFLGAFISYAVFWYFGVFGEATDATVTELQPSGGTYGSVG